MATVKTVLEKLKSSDGRIRIKTLSGVSVLVAVIALLVGVLPVMAHHTNSTLPGAEIPLGGGSGGCEFVVSKAGERLHLNNPVSGTYTGSDGTEIKIEVTNRVFSFEVLDPGKLVYDVTVNGGAKSNHYDYDGLGEPVKADTGLHAPTNPQGNPHNLSHINICYDGDVQFECNVSVSLEPDDKFSGEATIFTNSNVTCPQDGKLGSFFIEDDAVTLDFGSGSGPVAGRLDITKDFDSPTEFEALEYNGSNNFTGFDEVPWCGIRGFETGDGTQFSDWLGNVSYPKLPAGETACKVAENEDLSGTQLTVVYFEFLDPQFR